MMIRHWDINSGDLVTSGNEFIANREATAAGIYHRLRMFFGEWAFDITDGCPWFSAILGKAPQDVAEAALKQRILSAPGVVAITSFAFDIQRLTRQITVDCTVIDVNNQAVRLLFEEEII